MKNNKVIVISGFSRGGTNLLWNILQSHPQICSVRYETGTMFRKRRHNFSRVISVLRKTGLLRKPIGKSILDYQFYRYKLSNFSHEENRYKFEDEIYTKDEVKNCALCFKSTDLDINYTSHLSEMYPQLYFIGLTRNGYAVAEGHYRRGESITDFAKQYQQVAEKMKLLSDKLDNFKLVRFEEMLNDPFHLAKDLYEYLDCEPVELNKLRLKSKKVIKKDGAHEEIYGKPGSKYWFDTETIKDLIKPDVNNNQIKNLNSKQISEFNSIAKDALSYFGYQVNK